MPPAYEILLLNTAVPQIQAAQSGDTYVVPRDIAFSAALTLSAGTANGVPYLSSPGKVLTTGSALTFDGTTLGTSGLTVSTNRAQFKGNTSTGFTGGSVEIGYTGTVGIVNTYDRTASAYKNLEIYGNDIYNYVKGSNAIWDIAGVGETMRLTSTGLKASIAGTNADPVFSYTSDTNTGIFFPAADKLGFVAGGGSDQMVLTTTGLGIGTSSPGFAVDIAKATAVLRVQSTTGTNSAYMFTTNTGGDFYFGRENSTGSTFGSGTGYSSVLWSAGAYPMAFFTNGLERMRLDSSGNLGLGVTPSAWYTGYTASQIGVNGSVWANRTTADTNIVGIGSNQFLNSGATNRLYISDGFATRYEQANGAHSWFTAPSGTADGTAATSLTSAQNGNSYTIKVAGTTDFTLIGAANNNVGTTFTKSGGTGAGTGTVSQNISFTTAMTLDALGNLLVGGITNTSMATVQITVGSTSTASSALQLLSTTSGSNGIYFGDGTSSTDRYRGYFEYNHASDFMVFATAATERARITSGGYFKASNDGTYASSTGAYHELKTNANTPAVIITNSITSAFTDSVVNISLGYAANTTTNYFLQAYDTSVTRFYVRTNGGIGNYQSNNVDLSDIRTKKDIAPAPSYWNKIGALEIVTYKYNDQTHDDVNVGVIAQQVESVEPVWVDADGFGETPEDGVPLKTVYTKDITFAAIKALQEAMTRIEQLEAKVAALQGA